MPRPTARKSARTRVSEHRARLRAQGLRPIQFWVPDVESEEFRAEAHRQCQLLANNPADAEDQAFMESVAEFPNNMGPDFDDDYD
jgi:uncharacterized protein (DUF2336 family)